MAPYRFTRENNMSNINYHRYCDSIALTGYDKKTFLNKWYRRGVEWFNKYYKKEIPIICFVSYLCHFDFDCFCSKN